MTRKVSSLLYSANHNTYRRSAMAEASVADFTLVINQQIKNQWQTQVRLRHVETLLEVSLSPTNFYDLSKLRLHKYFSLMAQLINKIVSLNKKALKHYLCRRKRAYPVSAFTVVYPFLKLNLLA